MAFPMKKKAEKFKPAVKKGKQTRKGGKGTSLMHAAAKKSSAHSAGVSVKPTVSGQPSPNRADYELARLQKGND